MRKTAFLIAVAVLILGTAAMAANQFGIADTRPVTFYDTVRVGDTLLPAGNYVVTHQMQGDEHIMVFTRVGRKPVEARLKCTLRPLSAPAAQSQVEYRLNAAKEHVIARMVFKGDRAEHIFQAGN
ncbi:MAG: hypothetical protein LAN70_01070 [Acidobacteriia bacterium]|nr:hypothetical protein [Terriglobia bacterium]